MLELRGGFSTLVLFILSCFVQQYGILHVVLIVYNSGWLPQSFLTTGRVSVGSIQRVAAMTTRVTVRSNTAVEAHRNVIQTCM